MPRGERGYERVEGSDGLAAAGGSGYGSYQNAVQDLSTDPEDPFGLQASQVRITHERQMARLSARERNNRLMGWVVGPAVTLLLVIAFAVALMSGTSAPRALPTQAGTGPDAPMKAKTSPLDLANNITLPNATSVFICLEEECTPLVNQVGQGFKDLGNIDLLSCLLSSGANKTKAADCFTVAGPNTLRDNLVNCAGCNGCITLPNQDGIDKACAKYTAWSANKKDVPTATELVEPADSAVPAERSPPPTDSTSLYSSLPKHLKEKYCSEYWCP